MTKCGGALCAMNKEKEKTVSSSDCQNAKYETLRQVIQSEIYACGL